jgi:hypothetical protein
LLLGIATGLSLWLRLGRLGLVGRRADGTLSAPVAFARFTGVPHVSRIACITLVACIARWDEGWSGRGSRGGLAGEVVPLAELWTAITVGARLGSLGLGFGGRRERPSGRVAGLARGRLAGLAGGLAARRLAACTPFAGLVFGFIDGGMC